MSEESFNPNSFECSMCGDCCKTLDKKVVLIFPRDLKQITSKLELGTDEFIEKYCSEVAIEYEGGDISIWKLKDNSGVCVFLDRETNKCTIHDVKPEQCKRTPFGFFWDGEMHYECMEDVNIPNGWSTKEKDEQLVEDMLLELPVLD